MGRESYWCQLSAGPADHSAAIVLGCSPVRNRRLALRWMRGQAQRVVRALDPDPSDWWVANAPLHQVDTSFHAPDPAEALRVWVADAWEHDAVMRVLNRGQPYSLTVYDQSAYYSLSARPASVAFGTELRDPRPVHCAVA